MASDACARSMGGFTFTEQIESAEVIDPEAPRAGQAATMAFFGATVLYANAAGTEREVSIVGIDEVDSTATTSVGCRLSGAL